MSRDLPPEMPQTAHPQAAQSDRRGFSEVAQNLEMLCMRLKDLSDRLTRVRRGYIGAEPQAAPENLKEPKASDQNVLDNTLNHISRAFQSTEKINTQINALERELPENL